MSEDTQLISYTSAEEMAAVYMASVAKIRAAAELLTEAGSDLRGAFRDNYRFGVNLYYSSRHYDSNQVEMVIEQMKLDAWAAIIDRMNITRLMSSKRVQEMRDALNGRGDVKFPDITPDTIRSVAAGYVMSAQEFLEEAVREEYDHWRGRPGSKYKRNDFFKLNPKIIATYMVEPAWKANTFRCQYTRTPHITALDSIFHALAGLGQVKEFKGELASAIEMTEGGVGETQFFKFRCHKNGNLHLEFKRRDLLDLFNQIASRKWLPPASQQGC